MVNYSVNKHFWWIITIRQITCKRLLDILGIFSVFISFYRAILRRCDTDNFFVKAFKKINKLISELIYKTSLNEEFFKCFSWMSNFLLRIRKPVTTYRSFLVQVLQIKPMRFNYGKYFTFKRKLICNRLIFICITKFI